MQFFPGDWQRDPAVRACSLAARGLWIEMMCLMHQAEPYGFLVLNGKPIDAPTLARIVGVTKLEIDPLLAELDAAGVFNVDPNNGGIYSRRMLRDDRTRRARADGGKRSADNPNVPRSKLRPV